MSKDHWVIEWQHAEKANGDRISETVDSPEDAVRILRHLLAARFEDLFRAATPEILLRHMRDTVVYDSTNGRLVIRRVRS